LAATFLGGSGDEINGPDKVVVDAGGNVTIAGCTSSADYPVTPGARRPNDRPVQETVMKEDAAHRISRPQARRVFACGHGYVGEGLFDGQSRLPGKTAGRMDLPVPGPAIPHVHMHGDSLVLIRFVHQHTTDIYTLPLPIEVERIPRRVLRQTHA
jgi:hypothetical protein